MKTTYKNVFKQGAISSEFIAESIAKHQSKTDIGAHNIFLGQVRADCIRDTANCIGDAMATKTVAAIEYTAYKTMANKKFHEIREATFEKFDLNCMHIYHSIGIVNTGEICLFVFVSSAKRKAVFEALEYVVEKIKVDVPIFGKEIFKDASNNAAHQWKINQI